MVLGTYLVSFIFDSIYYYEILNINTPDFYARFPFMPLMVLWVFVSALLSSAILNIIAAGIEFCWEKICCFFRFVFKRKTNPRLSLMIKIDINIKILII